jgi:hypothetical protein
MVPFVHIRTHIVDYDYMSSNYDKNFFEHEVKRKLVHQLAESLIDKIEIRELHDPTAFGKTFEASLVAMSHQEYVANYGHMHHRRGISDGTMAMMQNGHWKVMNSGFPPSSPRPTPKVPEKTVVKKTAVDYLTERMKRS